MNSNHIQYVRDSDPNAKLWIFRLQEQEQEDNVYFLKYINYLEEQTYNSIILSWGNPFNYNIDKRDGFSANADGIRLISKTISSRVDNKVDTLDASSYSLAADDTLVAIGFLLKENPTIINVNLSKNGINDDTVPYLIQYILSVKTVQNVNLSNNNIKKEGWCQIFEFLKTEDGSHIIGLNIVNNPSFHELKELYIQFLGSDKCRIKQMSFVGDHHCVYYHQGSMNTNKSITDIDLNGAMNCFNDNLTYLLDDLNSNNNNVVTAIDISNSTFLDPSKISLSFFRFIQNNNKINRFSFKNAHISSNNMIDLCLFLRNSSINEIELTQLEIKPNAFDALMNLLSYNNNIKRVRILINPQNFITYVQKIKNLFNLKLFECFEIGLKIDIGQDINITADMFDGVADIVEHIQIESNGWFIFKIYCRSKITDIIREGATRIEHIMIRNTLNRIHGSVVDTFDYMINYKMDIIVNESENYLLLKQKQETNYSNIEYYMNSASYYIYNQQKLRSDGYYTELYGSRH